MIEKNLIISKRDLVNETPESFLPIEKSLKFSIHADVKTYVFVGTKQLRYWIFDPSQVFTAIHCLSVWKSGNISSVELLTLSGKILHVLHNVADFYLILLIFKMDNIIYYKCQWVKFKTYK